MAELLVLGGGIAGLSTGMLLARDGHSVVLLERDVQPAPTSIDEVTDSWTRPGVTQFHLPHYFQPRMTLELTREIPDVLAAAEQLGALRSNMLTLAGPMNGAKVQPGDECYDIVTARRPVMEAAFALTAEATPGLEVRRGVAVDALIATNGGNGSVPHVTGVRTTDGDELTADVVIDASGRRSGLPRWLDAIGARAPEEEAEEFGHAYYGRAYQGDALPDQLAPLLTPFGSVSVLTLPADNNVWLTTIVALAGDAPTRRLKDPEVFQRTIAEFPKFAHWGEGRPIHDDVWTMANIRDRLLRFVADDVPVATGVVAVGDAWACSNPSIGRGATIAFLHALALRDTLRDHGDDAPVDFALAFDALTREAVEPWFEATLDFDRARVPGMVAAIEGRDEDVSDPSAEISRALSYASSIDAEVFRGFSKIAGMLAPVPEVLETPGLLERAIELGADWRDHPPEGPDRARLLELLGS